MLATLLQYLITGLLIGGVYALMSVGLALIFGIMKVVNFAQGDFMMLGMFLTYFLHVAFGLHPFLGAPLTVPRLFLLGKPRARHTAGAYISGRSTTLSPWGCYSSSPMASP